MLRVCRQAYRVGHRTYKNFGHKREPEPRFTVLWHGFLTFSFIGMGIEWKRIMKFIFGEEPGVDSPVSLE